MVGSTEISIFEVRRSSLVPPFVYTLDISSITCPSALV